MSALDAVFSALRIKKGALSMLVGSAGGVISTTTLLNNVTTLFAGSAVELPSGRVSLQAFLTGSVAGIDLFAVVEIDVSNDGVHWSNIAPLILNVVSWNTIADDDTTEGTLDEPWAYVRGRVSSIDGSGASVSLIMSV